MAFCVTITSGADAQTADEDDARAHELFQNGADALGEGRYEFALVSFQEAYRLSPRPALLYNIAIAHDRLRHDAEAIAAYERYLAEAGDISNRAEIERRVEILRAQLERHTATTTQPETEPTGDPDPVVDTSTTMQDDEASDGGGMGALPWIVIGASAALAVGGVVLLGVGMGESASVTDAPDGAAWSDYEGAAARGGTFQTIGVIGLVVGLAGAATGVTLLVLDGGGDHETTASLTPSGIQVRGRF